MPQSSMIEMIENDCCSHLDECETHCVDLSARDLTLFPVEGVNFSQITKLLLDHNDIESIPDSIDSFPSLQVLSMTGNRLIRLPDCIGCLTCLQELLLNENELCSLPDRISELSQLQILNLTGNCLKELPESFGDLIKLKTLHIEENKLEILPSTLGLLENLEVLELCDNTISYLPVSIGRLKSLKILNMCNNKLDSIPETVGDMLSLETIDLSGNNVELLPSHFSSSVTLKRLFLDRNRITQLPDWVAELSCIEEFTASDNKLHEQSLTEKFGMTCRMIKHLDLGGNFMSQLPDSFGHLENLEQLHLGSVIDELERRNFQNGNWIGYLPTNFCQLIKLTELHFDENQLHELPDDFGNLINLEFIDLGQNLLYELPESFGNLKSLRICQLSKNNLQLLPSSFGNLTLLEDLRMDNNLLAELPESFCQLINLKTLDVFNNRLTEIPSALKYLTKLVRLDLVDNQFNIPWDEVPQIINSSKYPDRDPTLKNNWRGRPRQDLSMNDVPIIKLEMQEVEEFELPPPSLNYSEDVLKSAAINNLSIWRSHNGNQKRERFIRKFSTMPLFGQYNRKETESEEDQDDSDYEVDGDEDEDYEPPIFVSKNRNETEDKPVEAATSGENWDDEIEDIEIPVDNPYKTGKKTATQFKSDLYKLPPEMVEDSSKSGSGLPKLFERAASTESAPKYRSSPENEIQKENMKRAKAMSATGSVRGFTEFDDLCRGCQGYSYNLASLFDICDHDQFNRHTHTISFKEAFKRLKLTIKESFSNLEIQTERKVTDFTIGKTFVKQKPGVYFNPMKPITWSLGGGINGRWQDYKNDEYDGLIVLACIERDLIPQNIKECYKRAIQMNKKKIALHHQNYALALGQALIQYYAFIKPDERMRNQSFDIGNLSKEICKGGIVYVAYKLDPEPSYSDDEFEAHDNSVPAINVKQAAIDRLNLQLKKNGLYFCCDISNDGNSFFRACSDQLSRLELAKMDHLQLRQLIIPQLRDVSDVSLQTFLSHFVFLYFV
ncbi:Hypothetical predicted protein [Mytilus galloprovincialis]|uniref:Disease resistance R13L4/SHOC-2-like LRR domain-containing protein n=1 Tax=Mytilus galloprovincialis TaxID=29158 RepID=A0A8B6G6Q6_MYTGA|nr:Hypothetical predicted protein [Mytilus galloprovincialis]